MATCCGPVRSGGLLARHPRRVHRADPARHRRAPVGRGRGLWNRVHGGAPRRSGRSPQRRERIAGDTKHVRAGSLGAASQPLRRPGGRAVRDRRCGPISGIRRRRKDGRSADQYAARARPGNTPTKARGLARSTAKRPGFDAALRADSAPRFAGLERRSARNPAIRQSSGVRELPAEHVPLARRRS